MCSIFPSIHSVENTHNIQFLKLPPFFFKFFTSHLFIFCPNPSSSCHNSFHRSSGAQKSLSEKTSLITLFNVEPLQPTFSSFTENNHVLSLCMYVCAHVCAPMSIPVYTHRDTRHTLTHGLPPSFSMSVLRGHQRRHFVHCHISQA